MESLCNHKKGISSEIRRVAQLTRTRKRKKKKHKRTNLFQVFLVFRNRGGQEAKDMTRSLNIDQSPVLIKSVVNE